MPPDLSYTGERGKKGEDNKWEEKERRKLKGLRVKTTVFVLCVCFFPIPPVVFALPLELPSLPQLGSEVTLRALLPLPRYGTCLPFHRGNVSAFSPLIIDSRRIVGIDRSGPSKR